MTENNTGLTKSAQSVQDALTAKGLNFKVIELAASTRTAIDAANTIGCEIAQIIKSLIFRIVEDNQPILVLASGVNRVNEKKLEIEIGKKIQKADADYIRAVTGFAIGGIPPVGHKQPIATYIDVDLLQFDSLWAAAGTPNAVFSLKPTDMVTLTNGKLISIK